MADQFRNTCTTPLEVGSDYNFDTVGGITPATVTCPNWSIFVRVALDACTTMPNAGSSIQPADAGEVWVCGQDGKAMIRVQTNNMPDHCPGNSLVKPQEFDYEVLFNSPIDSGSNNFDFLNQLTVVPKFVPGGGGTQDVEYNNKGGA